MGSIHWSENDLTFRQNTEPWEDQRSLELSHLCKVSFSPLPGMVSLPGSHPSIREFTECPLDFKHGGEFQVDKNEHVTSQVLALRD